MEQDDFINDDDFGELYADLQVLATPPPPSPSPQQHQQHHDNDDDGGSGGGDSNNNDDTESEDGLNIVLNDDDCPIPCVEDVVHREGLENNQEECIDQEQQFVSSDAHCGQSSKICVRGGYGSQFFRSKVRILLLFFFFFFNFMLLITGMDPLMCNFQIAFLSQ